MAKARKCPECNGLPRGRGFAHESGCSLATRPQSTGKKRKYTRRNAATISSSSGDIGVDLRRLRGAGIDVLMDIRNKIDSIIRQSAPKVQAQIKKLQQTLKAIGK